MLAESASRSWSKFIRLSVRGLIVLVLVIAVGMGWLAHSARVSARSSYGYPEVRRFC